MSNLLNNVYEDDLEHSGAMTILSKAIKLNAHLLVSPLPTQLYTSPEIPL